MTARPAAAAAVLLLAGCGLIEALSTTREIGHILVTPDPHLRTILAPDTAVSATPFDITVNTFGSSSCTKPDGVSLTTSPLLVRITPYDKITTAGACTADFASRPHPVSVRFTVAGTGTIRVVGRSGTGLDSVEHSVLVK